MAAQLSLSLSSLGVLTCILSMDASVAQVGDKLVMVNGHDVEVCDHYEAVNIMREAGSQLRLEVSREVTRIVPEKVGIYKKKKENS